MNWFPAAKLVLMLQSNEAIARAIETGQGLVPYWQAYAGTITGIFATIFLMMISGWAVVVHNYGVAIVLTAVMVRLFLLPLTRIQIRSMKSMQMLQPVMKEIQRFYPNKQEQSAKMMELYQTFKINPLSGCLPMLIQLPILFGVYRALYDPSFAGRDFIGIQLLFPVNVTGGRNFSVGPDLADLVDITIAKLGLQHQIIRLPETIPLIGGGFWYLPALILVVLYVATSLYMQRVMRQVNQPDPAFTAEFKEEMKVKADGPREPDLAQQMQRQMGLMNLMIIIFAFIFSAGALLYFIVQNLLMMLEYTFLPRGMKLALDPKELKAFIRRPPQATAAAGQTRKDQPAVQKVDAVGRLVPEGNPGAGEAASVENGASETADQVDSLNGFEDGGEASDGLRRPRKKRRKK